jgi:hypothetical protein
VRRLESWAIAGGLAYLVVLGVAMQRLSYDVWGALVIVPIIVLVSWPLINTAFRHDLAWLRPYAWVGLFAKLAGAVLAYQVRFAVLGSGFDASRYHREGRLLAGSVRAGRSSVLAVLPTSDGTIFIDEFTGLVYTIFGSSRLGGFFLFAWLGYWGWVFFIKAAAVAVPGLAVRRYALAVFLFPSLAYWGSEIGKEAFMGLCLGLAAYGVALVVGDTGRRRTGLLLAAIGLLGAARVRPHFAAIWAGAAVVALLVRVVVDATRTNESGRRGVPVSSLFLAVLAVVGFVVIATAALEFLPDAAEEDNAPVTDRIGAIFDGVENRTDQGGSSFDPVRVNGPQDWPYAAYRTLTRPLLTEARSFSELLPAVEMTALLFVGLLSWRRLANAPKLILTTPYLMFAALCLLTFGVAFASFANLGLLVRQRTLVTPFLLLFLCIPPIGTKVTRTGSNELLVEDRSKV